MNKLLERDSKIQYLEAELQEYQEHKCVKMVGFLKILLDYITSCSIVHIRVNEV